jgi:hypothetical protein
MTGLDVNGFDGKSHEGRDEFEPMMKAAFEQTI